jgi:hypothetical protein
MDGKKIGQCTVVSARPSCPHCFCDYYLKIMTSTWHGNGWPLNPASRASTGCVSTILWGGYQRSMITNNLLHNAAEQARHALCHPADPCRIHSKNAGLEIHNTDVLGN